LFWSERIVTTGGRPEDAMKGWTIRSRASASQTRRKSWTVMVSE
jgi:hypothetical protein